MDNKTVRIEIAYSDGSRDVAEGDAADQIMRWFNSCQMMNHIHGAVYNGPQMTHVPAALATESAENSSTGQPS